MSKLKEESVNTETKRSNVPDGKRVLNTHISDEEHSYLRSKASRERMTITMFLRNLIRREMSRDQMEQPRRAG